MEQFTEKQLDNIIVKIQALLSKTTERGATEAEATSAAAKASDLLLKYNLSMAQVRDQDRADAGASYYNRVVTLGVDKGDVIDWRRDLLNGLARLHFCRMVFWRGNATAAVIGQDINIDATLNLYDYLTATVDRLSAESWETTKAANGGRAPQVERWHYRRERGQRIQDHFKGYGPQHPKQYRMSFAIGCSGRILTRLREQREAAVQNDPQTMALVLVSDEALDQAKQAFYPDPRPEQNNGRRIDVEAYLAGQAAADSISLEKQVGAGATRALRTGA